MTPDLKAMRNALAQYYDGGITSEGYATIRSGIEAMAAELELKSYRVDVAYEQRDGALKQLEQAKEDTRRLRAELFFSQQTRASIASQGGKD